jgi:hypothetical protein
MIMASQARKKAMRSRTPLTLTQMRGISMSENAASAAHHTAHDGGNPSVTHSNNRGFEMPVKIPSGMSTKATSREMAIARLGRKSGP